MKKGIVAFILIVSIVFSGYGINNLYQDANVVNDISVLEPDDNEKPDDAKLEQCDYIQVDTKPLLQQFPDLICEPSIFDEKAILVFSQNPDGYNNNVFEYDITYGTYSELPLSSWSKVQVDESCYYYLSGEIAQGFSSIIAVNKETLEQTILYQAPDNWEIASNLSYGENFLVWAQFEKNAERSQGFSLCAYDIVNGEAFTIYSNCYGLPGFPYVINNGCIAFYSENAANMEKPYVLLGYNLNIRKIMLNKNVDKAPSGMCFNGNTFVWVDRLGDALHYSQLGSDAIFDIDIDAGYVDIWKDDYIIYSKYNKNLYVYSILQKKIIYNTESCSELTADNEYFYAPFDLDHSNGVAAFISFKKSQPYGENNENLVFVSLMT